MKLLISKPNTPGTRHYKYVYKNFLSRSNKLLKLLIFKIHSSFGKSFTSGHTTIWGRNSGCKKLYRKLEFFNNNNTLGIILFSTYDPNRTAFIFAVFDFLKLKFFYALGTHLLTSGCIIGSKLPNYKYFLGFRYNLNSQLQGSILSMVSLKKNKKAQYALAAGTYCQLLYKSLSVCKVRLPSNQIIHISSNCFATLGIISNIYNRFINIGKAGRNRLFGLKPQVRGIAMNPVDHPHGGRSNGGCCWVTPWGKPFKFKKTSNSKILKIYKLL
jgi:large subunit ribosomal protein L2